MIDSMDIYRAIKKTLEKNFNIKVQIKDIKNPCPPCFYIKPITDSSRQTANNYETTDYSYSIIYFSEDETLEDLLTVKEALKNLLKLPLKVIAYKDETDINWLEINSTDFSLDESDYILQAVINIEHTQRLGVTRFESDNTELMEVMEISTDYTES